jgi:small-conductance mechanosensitive channel
MDTDDFSSLLLDTWNDLHQPRFLWQLGTIAACFLVGWIVARVTRNALEKRTKHYIERDPERNERLVRTRYGGLDLMIWPLFSWALLVLGEHVMHAYRQPTHFVRIAAILAIAYVGIHLGLYTLRRVFKPSPGMLIAERWFGILAWLLVALNVTGLLPDVIATLSGPDATFTFGKNVNVSVWQFLTAVVSIGITLVAALGLGAVLEARLMRADSIDASMRIVLGRLGKAILVVVAVLVAMRLVDIDITVLSVFGGALGVGLGLGLQRIASNYVSGFIILLDRSLRIGDVINVDKYKGEVTQIRTRCTVVRDAAGVEALVPNELLLNQAVQNFSFGDKNGSGVTRIRVAYDTDVDVARQLMLDAAAAQERVLKDPATTANLKEFGADGIELELTFFVPDPEKGTDGLRSDINRAIWTSFRAAGIRVPYPQREVRVLGDSVPGSLQTQGS